MSSYKISINCGYPITYKDSSYDNFLKNRGNTTKIFIVTTTKSDKRIIIDPYIRYFTLVQSIHTYIKLCEDIFKIRDDLKSMVFYQCLFNSDGTLKEKFTFYEIKRIYASNC